MPFLDIVLPGMVYWRISRTARWRQGHGEGNEPLRSNMLFHVDHDTIH